jgi:hypothetical protein
MSLRSVMDPRSLSAVVRQGTTAEDGAGCLKFRPLSPEESRRRAMAYHKDAAALLDRMLKLDKGDASIPELKKRMHQLSARATALEDIANQAAVRESLCEREGSEIVCEVLVVAVVVTAIATAVVVVVVQGKYDVDTSVPPVAPPRSDVVAFISRLPERHARKLEAQARADACACRVECMAVMPRLMSRCASVACCARLVLPCRGMRAPSLVFPRSYQRRGGVSLLQRWYSPREWRSRRRTPTRTRMKVRCCQARPQL